jgi:F-type H+-transporting ATPase subunit b
VALLRYFLYHRIVNAMEQRKQKIQDQFDDARRERQEAAKESDALERRKQELEEQRNEILSTAEKEAQKHREQMIEKAHSEVEDKRRQWQEFLRQDQVSFLKELRQKAGHQVFAASRKLLKDLGDAAIEEQMISLFTNHIRALDQEKKREMAEAVEKSDYNVTVCSAFDLSDLIKKDISGVIQAEITDKAQFHYEKSKALVLGIEIKCRGRKISWSSEDYLKDLEKEVNYLFEKENHRMEKSSQSITPDWGDENSSKLA